MRNIILFVLIIACITPVVAQEVISPDLKTMNWMGRVPQKTQRNTPADILIKTLYYDIQPENYPKIGYLNTNGKVLVKPIYNMGSDFYGDYANVIKDSIYGYIDKKGNETFFENFRKVFFYYGNTGIAIKEGKYGLINREGDSLTGFNYNTMYNYGFDHFKCNTASGKSYILNSEGNIVFDNDLDFNIVSYFFESDSLIIYEKVIGSKKLKGLLNLKGEEVISAKYDEIVFIEDDQLRVVYIDNKYGFIDKSRREVVPPIYEKVAFEIREELILAQNSDKKWGFINRKNKEVIPFIYDKASPFVKGLSFVEKDGKVFCINKKNKVKLNFNLMNLDFPFFADGMAVFNEDGKYGFINTKGKIVIPAQYDKAYPFINGLAYVMKNDKSGYINEKGKEIIPLKYNQIWLPSEDMIRYAE